MIILFVLLLLVNSLLAACPSGSVVIPSNLGSEWSCLSIISSTNGFKKAELQCQRNNGHLVSIPNASFNAWLSQNVLSVSSSNNLTSKHWIGVRNINGNKWQNVDDNSTVTYFDWSSGEPAQETNSNGCVSQDLKGRWYNDNCDQLYSFVCEVPEIKITTTQKTTPQLTLSPKPPTTLIIRSTTKRPQRTTTLPKPKFCRAQSCFTYTPACSANPLCACVQTTGGRGFCTTDVLCDALPDCSICPPTAFVCVINTCCFVPKCVPLILGDACIKPPINLMSYFHRPLTSKFCKENKDCPSGLTCKLHLAGSFCV